MTQPNLRHLKIDRVSTRKMRTALSKKDRITITVNLNTGSLRSLQRLSKKNGIPYQRLLNTLLTNEAAQQNSIQFRLDRLEQELQKIKHHVAA